MPRARRIVSSSVPKKPVSRTWVMTTSPACGDFLDDPGLRGAFEEGLLLADHGEGGGVGDEVRVAGSVGDARVDDEAAAGPHHIGDPSRVRRDPVPGDLPSEERAEYPVGADDLVLPVDADDGGPRRVEFLH
jgi:hypothetical protein